MDADLDTLRHCACAAAFDASLKDNATLAPRLPKGSFRPKLTDAELMTLAVMQAVAGSLQTRWLRLARLTPLSPVPPSAPAVRLQQAAAGRGPRQGLDLDLGDGDRRWRDDCRWSIDPREFARSRPTANGPNPGGSAYPTAPPIPATSGACAAPDVHPGGLPIACALTNPKTDNAK